MKLQDIAKLILRVTVGIIIAAHGLQKLFGLFGGPGIEGTIQMMGNMGFPIPVLSGWFLALGESLGGILLILGILPRVSGLVVAVIMLGAIFRVHFDGGLFASNGGFEYPLLIFAVSVYFMLSGSGKLSILNKY